MVTKYDKIDYIRFREQEMLDSQGEFPVLQTKKDRTTSEEIREARRKAREDKVIVELVYLPALGKLLWKDRSGREGLAPKEDLTESLGGKLKIGNRNVPFDLVVSVLGNQHSNI